MAKFIQTVTGEIFEVVSEFGVPENILYKVKERGYAVAASAVVKIADSKEALTGDCGINYFRDTDKCEHCSLGKTKDTCDRYKNIEREYEKAIDEIYSAPYREGRYNGD